MEPKVFVSGYHEVSVEKINKQNSIQLSDAEIQKTQLALKTLPTNGGWSGALLVQIDQK